MKNYFIRYFFILLGIYVFHSNPVWPQESIENQIRVIDNEISLLRQGNFHLMSPKNFEDVLSEFEKAKSDYQKGKKIKNIEEKLDKTVAKLTLVKEIGEQGRVLFKDVLKARSDALSAQATEFAPEIFLESEDSFIKAAKKLEKGDLNGARKEGEKAELQYRDSELLAIKENIIGKVADLLAQAEENKISEHAPYTLTQAEKYFQEARKILNQDRYSKENARETARKAEYEVLHAIYLADVIKKLSQDENNWELLLLNFEDRFSKISQQLGFEGNYLEGLAKTENDILLAIQNQKEENKSLKEELAELQKQNEVLAEKIDNYENTVVSELEFKRQWDDKLQKIQKVFTGNEAQVLQADQSLVIRLYGLTFQSGQSNILPEHFFILTKVMKVLREFPGSRVRIAGHTDALGNDAYNSQLSEQRAFAIQSYLEANMNSAIGNIFSIGYGESRPIASNETLEGRRINRRIEVIVDMNKEQLSEHFE